ncbi:MAG: TIR domain-containing protein [Opitutus sp.]
MSVGGASAVFLSYASQDAEAARKICAALRSGGVEVWLDADGGLEHGDEWDAKIRRQIKECVLFIPLISANTQARHEGYFRIEWELAAQRAMGIASGVAFILPVVIDGTREPDALVPDRFRAVQWTKLPGGVVPPEVQARFLKLWSHRTGALKPEAKVGVGASLDDARELAPGYGRRPVTPLPKRSPVTYALLAFGLLVAGCVAYVVLKPNRNSREIAASSASAPALDGKTAGQSAAAQQSESDKLVDKVWVQLNKTELSRAELEIADSHGKRATELDPNDADAWAAWSQVDSWFVAHGLDTTAERREAARNKAAKALQLAPANYEARLAQACYLVRGGGDLVAPSDTRAAEKLLQSLLRERSDEPRALLALGILQSNAGRASEARATYDRLAGNPTFAVIAWNEIGWADLVAGNYAEAEVAADRSIALQSYWGNLTLKALLAVWWRGDLDLAKSTFDLIPAAVHQEDDGVANDCQLLFFRREPEALLRLLDGVPRDWLHSNAYDGPKAFWAAAAQEQLGRPERARLQWQTALTQIERRLADRPDADALLRLKATALAALGQGAEADRIVQLARESVSAGSIQSFVRDVATQLRLGHSAAALDLLEHEPRLTAAACRITPQFDALRSQPRFQALLARLDSDPRASPQAAKVTATHALDEKSVAVLAFANLSDDKGNEYFSDGISEELLNVLAKIPGLKVTARTSAFFFKGKQVSVADIAQQLGVAYVVEGSVRKQGDRVRITAQLIKASDGFHVWSDTFTRELKDIFAVQDEIAGLIAQQMQLKLGVKQPARVVDPEAHRLVLEARFYWNQRGDQNFDRTEALLKQALAIDPDFAAAHAAMADLWVMRAAYRATEGLSDVSTELRAVQASVTRALELDSTRIEPYATKAYSLMMEGKLVESGQWFDRALKLRPDDPTVRFWHALHLMNRGEIAAAANEYERARRSDPLSFIIAFLSAQCAQALGRTQDALGLLQNAHELRLGGFVPAQGVRAMLLWQTGKTDEAIALARVVRSSWPAGPRWQADADALWVLREAGLKEEATTLSDKLLKELPAESSQRGWVLLTLGRMDEALPYLEHQPNLNRFQMAWNPHFDPWRNDPRFRQLLKKLNWENEYDRARAQMPAAAKP